MKAPNSTYSISPFGITLDNRTISSDSYRYGFQNQEVDDEVKGEGNSVNYKYRMHDPRVGRFFTIDPLAGEYPWNSPYAFSENVVIDHIELEGLEKADPVTGKPDYSSFGGVHPSEYEKQQKQKPPSSIIPSGVNPIKPLPLVTLPKLTPSNPSNNSPSQTQTGLSEGARSVNDAIGDATTVTESTLNQAKLKASTARTVAKNIGLVSTVIEGGTIIEDFSETGNAQKAAGETALLVFETAVVDRLLTTPTPITIGLALGYYAFKAIVTDPVENKYTPLPDEWILKRDQDNTRTDGTGGGF